MADIKNQFELTLRGFILATVLTVVFTAANIYLGLKVKVDYSSWTRVDLRSGISDDSSLLCVKTDK